MIDLGLGGSGRSRPRAGYIPGNGRVTGGHQLALKLAEAGAAVGCIDIDEGRAVGIVGEIEAAGGKAAFPVIADMTDLAQVRRAIDDAVGELGGIDVCVDTDVARPGGTAPGTSPRKSGPGRSRTT